MDVEEAPAALASPRPGLKHALAIDTYIEGGELVGLAEAGACGVAVASVASSPSSRPSAGPRTGACDSRFDGGKEVLIDVGALTQVGGVQRHMEALEADVKRGALTKAELQRHVVALAEAVQRSGLVPG